MHYSKHERSFIYFALHVLVTCDDEQNDVIDMLKKEENLNGKEKDEG